MRILITGKNSQMGKTFQKIIDESNLNHNFIFVGRKDFDLSSSNQIEDYFKINSFDIIINCAAYTMVDEAEENYELVNKINHLSVQQMTNISKKINTKFIHISTDYVFDGDTDRPYLETDKTNPINVYGKTKLAAELTIKNNMPTNALIIRTSWLYSEFGSNFVRNMLKLANHKSYLNIVNDQIGSPTYAADLVKSILDIINNKTFLEKKFKTEIYHYSNDGAISWFFFTKEILEIAKIKCIINPILTKEYPTLSRRPKNSVMNTDKIKNKFGLNIPNWNLSLGLCIRNIRKNDINF